MRKILVFYLLGFLTGELSLLATLVVRGFIGYLVAFIGGVLIFLLAKKW